MFVLADDDPRSGQNIMGKYEYYPGANLKAQPLPARYCTAMATNLDQKWVRFLSVLVLLAGEREKSQGKKPGKPTL